MASLIQRSDLLDMAPVVIHTHKVIKLFTSSLPCDCDPRNARGNRVVLQGGGGDSGIGLCENSGDLHAH
ncbi:hypothetical protein JUNP479_4012 [Aeromonas jandaei]|nr:hypothetical protein JUNP479_4012 [Aeromonas jandaei]